ncbi:MAG: hypothetical protein KDK04_21425 [Candidatus Competibacteraceae bacterium]|nr:hypothetical protein [Candidatus Competibacteraceae bacterium]MCB1814256.1 hypothetical protein [Candidatus Competibacteraceae bacterium]
MHYANSLLLASLLMFTALPPLAAQESASKPSVLERELTTLTAKVIAVDAATRQITLQDEQGTIAQTIVGDEVRNFDQIDIGDTVITQLYRALAIEVTESQDKVLRTEVSVDTARVEPGQKPGGLAISQITVTAEVMAIDPEARTVTIKRQQQGEPAIVLQTVEVRESTNLDNIDPGDMVIMTYQQSVAISVQEIQ